MPSQFRRIVLVLGLGLVLAVVPATGQDALRFDHVTAEDGLSGPEVWQIHQDADGFMWFSTGEALDRYDGYSIKSYGSDPRQVGSLSHHNVSALLTDARGRFWVGTSGGGLNLYLSGEDRFVHFRHRPGDPASLSSDRVLCLLEDRDGSLWVGTDSGLDHLELPVGDPLEEPRHPMGLEAFVRVRQASEGSRHFSGKAVHALAEGVDGALWVGTEAGLDVFEPGAGSIRPVDGASMPPAASSQQGAGGGTVSTIQQDAAGHLWFGGSHGLSRLDPTSGAIERFRHDPMDRQSLSSDRVRDLLLDRLGTLWISTGSGLDVFEPTRGTFRHHVNDVADLHSLGVTPINSLFEDRTGVIWIGTGDGVSRWHPGRAAFRTYRRQSGRESTLASSDVWAVEEEASGALWIALGASGLDRLDRTTGAVDHYVHDPAVPDSLQNGLISTVYEDGRGDLWVGSLQGGLSRFDPRRSRFVRFRHDVASPQSVSSDDVHRFFEDSSGRFWVCTAAGLNLLDRDSGRFTRFPAAPQDPPSLGYAAFIAVVEDDANALWLASLSHGLFLLPRGATAFETIEAVGQQEVISLLADGDGGLWVGTGNGLLLLDRRSREVIRRYGLPDGLPGTTIRGLQQDRLGRLWIASNHGLSRFDRSAEAFRNYDVQDGLQGVSFSTKADLLSSSGELFFGGWRGLSAFFPDHIEEDPHPPAVVITDFRLFNRSVLPRALDPESPLTGSIHDTQELVLDHRQYVFSFEIAALHYAAPGKNRYAYRLEGLDHDWVSADASQRLVQYTGLRPGRYTFRAKASNKDGVWNEDGVRLDIRILPPPWRSAWAYAAYAAVLLLAAGLYFKAQATKLRRERRAAAHERAIAERERAVSRRLQTVDKLKDEFLANTSHELRTPLYGITGLAESLIDGATGELPQATQANLGMIVASGRRLSHLVNDILDFSKLKHNSLELDRKPVDLARPHRSGADLVAAAGEVEGSCGWSTRCRRSCRRPTPTRIVCSRSSTTWWAMP